MDIAAVLIAIVTLAAGAAAGWSLGQNQASRNAANERAATAAAIAERDNIAMDRERISAERESERQATRHEREAERAEVRAELEQANAARRAAELQARESATKLTALREGEVAFKDAFARLSGEALQANRRQFLELADDRFKQAGVPIAESLQKVERQLGEIEKERASTNATLTQQIKSIGDTGDALRTETAALVSALRKPQARGRWGELQLRRCVELAGMTDRCDFTEQTSVTTAEGTLRPDMVIRLVGGKSLVVDSKVTLSAFLEAYETDDDAVREARLGAHARHLRQHVDSLAAKSYWSQFSSAPEFVVLFVPSDALLAAALDRDVALIDDAFTKRVHIATPTTLISVLRTVAYAWQQQALATNAQEVFELGRELYKRLGTMGDHMDKLGRSLTSAVKNYNGTVGSMEKQVLVTARKLNALEVVDGELADPTPIEEPVRPLGATELVTAAEDGRAVFVLPMSDDTDSTDIDSTPLRGRVEDYGIEIAPPPTDVTGRRTGS